MCVGKIEKPARLALATILNGKQNKFLVVAAPVCSSFVPINSGTHRRSLIDPLGRRDLPSVVAGNLLTSRRPSPNRSKPNLCFPAVVGVWRAFEEVLGRSWGILEGRGKVLGRAWTSFRQAWPGLAGFWGLLQTSGGVDIIKKSSCKFT